MLVYLHAQEAAEINKAGLWLDLEPIASWDFRDHKKTK